jgi:hypothetical protein
MSKPATNRGTAAPPSGDVPPRDTLLLPDGTPHPDAALMRASTEYMSLAVILKTGIWPDGKGRMWDDYRRFVDVISKAVPVTMDGVFAKAWAAKWAARTAVDRPEDLHQTNAMDAMAADCLEDRNQPIASEWAWDVLNDLLRLKTGGKT